MKDEGSLHSFQVGSKFLVLSSGASLFHELGSIKFGIGSCSVELSLTISSKRQEPEESRFVGSLIQSFCSPHGYLVIYYS